MYILLILSLILNLSMLSSVFWFPSWVILELTGFIFMMILSISRSSSVTKKSCMWKYFLYQCIGSIFLLMCMFMKLNQVSYTSSYSMGAMMVLGLMMKLGLPPFHKWSFEVSENLDWMKFFLINSIQKTPSLIMVWKLVDMNFLVISITMIVLLFSLLGVYDWSLRRFLMYSSIMNYIWILISSFIDSMSMLFYLVVYMWTFMGVVIVLSNLSFTCFSFLFSNNSYFSLGSLMNIITSTNFMSLAGLPPLAGFLAKYDVIICLILNCLMIMSFIMMLISMIMLYMYIMLMICSTITNKLMHGTFVIKDSYVIMIFALNLVVPIMYFM